MNHKLNTTSILLKSIKSFLLFIVFLTVSSCRQEFADMDWNNVKISISRDSSLLLRIKSKSDPSKILLYNKKNKVIHARWVYFKSVTKQTNGEIKVNSLNETKSIVSSFKNG